MPVLLDEAKKLSTDTLQRGVIELFARTSPVMELLPFMPISGNAYNYNQEATLPGVAYRDVNQGYEESEGAVAQKSDHLVMLGGDVDVDKFIVQTLGNLNDQRAIQTNLKVKSLSKKFTHDFFKGKTSENPLSFDGLDARIESNGQNIVAGTDGANLTTDHLYALLDAVEGGADVLYMTKAMRRELQKVLNASNHFIETGKDAFGRPIEMFGGVQIRTVEDDVLPFTETVGTATNCSSIYAVKFGEQEYISGLTNGGIQVQDLGQLQEKPVYRTRIEFYCGLADFNPKAAARLSGIIR